MRTEEAIHMGHGGCSAAIVWPSVWGRRGRVRNTPLNFVPLFPLTNKNLPADCTSYKGVEYGTPPSLRFSPPLKYILNPNGA